MGGSWSVRSQKAEFELGRAAYEPPVYADFLAVKA